MTNDALERIWAYEHCQQVTAARSPTWFSRWADAHEYIRVDHAQAELQAAVAAEREACAKKVENTDAWKFYSYAERDRVAKSVRARGDTDAQAALEAVKREARDEALRDALPVASALAAAISLLDRARLQAPSDKMFEQMVLDYQRALDDFRRAVQGCANTDAQAALERVKQEAKAEALREAIDAVHQECWTDGDQDQVTPELLAEQATTTLAIRAIKALEEEIRDCEGYLKDGETPAQRIERDARNEALKEAAVNLKAYAPHLEDGPENDVGYYHGYHTALNRILALMEDTGGE